MGSTHDSTAWEDTQIVQEHEDIIKDGEWIWADSAYPVRTCLCFYVPDSPILTFCLKISAWVVAPYKKPKRDLPDNEVFNSHVSQVCIRSEHAIGYLKGQFQSLKELCVKIKNQKSHKFATYWIACCIGLHAFAMACENDEENNDFDRQNFINNGLSSSSGSESDFAPAQQRPGWLREGKRHCEALKRRLFRAKERQQHR